jgi:hypothetical protein
MPRLSRHCLYRLSRGLADLPQPDHPGAERAGAQAPALSLPGDELAEVVHFIYALALLPAGMRIDRLAGPGIDGVAALRLV